MMDEPKFAQPIPNVTVAGTKGEFSDDLSVLPFRFVFFPTHSILFFITVGRDANLPCVVEHLGTYKVSMKSAEKIQNKFMAGLVYGRFLISALTKLSKSVDFAFSKLALRNKLIRAPENLWLI